MSRDIREQKLDETVPRIVRRQLARKARRAERTELRNEVHDWNDYTRREIEPDWDRMAPSFDGISVPSFLFT
jgi:hypothetical protein